MQSLRLVPPGGRPQEAPLKRDSKTVFESWVLIFPLSRAGHRRGGRIKACGLSDPAPPQAGGVPRAPAAVTTRRINKSSPRPPSEVQGLD